MVFAVFDFDRFTRNDEIGEVSQNYCIIIIFIIEVRIRMCNIDLAFGEEDWQEILPVQGNGQVTEILCPGV